MKKSENLPEKIEDFEKLTPREARFIAEYPKDFNGKRAAIRAGYKENTASSVAAKLLSSEKIKTLLGNIQRTAAMEAGVTSVRVLQELARLAFVDERKLYDKTGRMLLPHEWDDDTAAAVSGLEIDEITIGRGESKKTLGYTKKVKTYSKTEALKLLSMHLQLLKDNDPETERKLIVEINTFVHNSAQSHTDVKVINGNTGQDG